MNKLQTIIDDAFENRASITPTNVPKETKEAIDEAMDMLNNGTARVAEAVLAIVLGTINGPIKQSYCHLE